MNVSKFKMKSLEEKNHNIFEIDQGLKNRKCGGKKT